MPASSDVSVSRRRLRLRKFIKPRLQLKLVLGFTSAGLLAVTMAVILFARAMNGFASELPGAAGAEVVAALPALLLRAAMITIAVVVPVIVVVGTFVSFSIAGPAYRLERFLDAVADGVQVEPCRLRAGDELGELCERANRATEPLRAIAGAEKELAAASPKLRAVA